MIFKMAWRNLWRNTRRTVITLVSITFGFLLSVTFTTISDGSYGKMIDDSAKMGAGHVTVEPVGYRDKPGTNLVLENAKTLSEKLLEKDYISASTVRIVGESMISSATDSMAAGFSALDPDNEKDMFFLFKHIVKGNVFKSSKSKKVLIGKKMAAQLAVKLKKKLVLTTTNKNGEVVSGLVRVGGIFETGIDALDKSFIVLPIDYMRDLLGYTSDQAGQVTVLLNDRRNAGRAAANIDAIAHKHNGVAQPWTTMMPDVAGGIIMDKVGNYFFQVFIFLLIAAGILNTVLMSVLERIREFGIMLAIGMSPFRLWKLVMSETFVLAIVGLLTGGLVSYPIYYYFHTIGLDLTSFMKEGMSMGNVLFDPIVFAQLYWDHIAIIFGGVFVLIMLAGLYPAFISTRIRPADTIKLI